VVDRFVPQAKCRARLCYVPVFILCTCPSGAAAVCMCVCLLRMCVSVSRHTVVAVDEVSEAVESGARVSPL
jgi:hypothetical protein